MLTDREKELLRIITQLTEEKGYSPSYREIGAAAGIKSTNGVRYFLNQLEAKGHLRRDQGLSRAIELSDTTARPSPNRFPRAAASMASSLDQAVSVPILGRVAAGYPVLSDENVEDQLLVDPSLATAGHTFALRVRGESMKDAGILEGDMVVVREQNDARNGDIVVALVDGEATVKTYRVRRNGTVVLEPANSEFEPIEISPERPLEIRGKVVAVLRKVGA
jgi:repressor LexA